MLCESCKKNNATFHYHHSENGNVTETHLCHECAKKLGLADSVTGSFENFGSEILDDFFGTNPFASFFGESPLRKSLGAKQRICPFCGMSEAELLKNGRVGCKECYSTFSDVLHSMLKKMQPSIEYKGKLPGEHGEFSKERKLEKLREDMQKAVEKQEYEEAAKLRDAIRMLENSADDTKDREDGKDVKNDGEKPGNAS